MTALMHMAVFSFALALPTDSLAMREHRLDSLENSLDPFKYEYWFKRDRELIRRPTRTSTEWADVDFWERAV